MDYVKYDKDIAKEFKIGSIEDITDDQKTAYLTNQINELKVMAFRNRVDIGVSQALIERNQGDSEVEMAMRSEGEKNRAQFRNNLKQTLGAIRHFAVLRDALEK